MPISATIIPAATRAEASEMVHRTAPMPGLLPTALLLALATPSAAQDSGAIQGTVVDSLTLEPLVDAAVVLWDTPYRTATDSAGAFRFEDVPAGDYSLLFFHGVLGQRGVSAGPRAVTVRPGETAAVSLGTPSMFTMVASECLHEAHPRGTGVVAGWVGDRESGMGLPGSSVVLSWNVDDAKAPERLSLQTDSRGWYAACDAPADVPITVSARFLSRTGLRREVRVEPGEMAEAGFLLGEYGPATIHGRLVDAASGEAVTEAEVWLRGTAFRGITAPNGRFEFDRVPPGTYMLMTKHLGYGTKMDTLEVPSGEAIQVEMLLDTRAIEIAPLTVTVESAPLTIRSMGGYAVERHEIEAVRARTRDLGDIMQALQVPGVIVDRTQGEMCIGYLTGQIRMMFRDNCTSMLIFIDNIRVANPDAAAQISPDAIERIVVYKPVEAGNLFGAGAANGVLAIFTRH